MVTVVGGSSTGKSRTLYEAVLHVLRNWPVLHPRGAAELVRQLEGGIPGRSVLWLDELQAYLDDKTDGPIAARYLTDLLTGPTVPAFAVVASIWPDNLARIATKPDSRTSQRGDQADAAALTALIQHMHLVAIPDNFAELSEEDWDSVGAAAQDPRMLLALSTAGAEGRVTQILAGGVQLLHRLYPDEPEARLSTAPSYTHAARAVITAALEMRRVGHPNPVPEWAIKSAAEGHLTGPDKVQPEGWLGAALIEASNDQETPGLLVRGIPALTPTRLGVGIGPPDAYAVHDFLVQEHLIRHRHTPTTPQLWEGIVAHAADLAPETASRLADAAVDRGLYSTAHALALVGVSRDSDSYSALRWELDVETDRELDQGVAALAARAEHGDRAALERLVDLLADRGDDRALASRADNGDWSAQRGLADLLADRVDDSALAARADKGERPAQQCLADLLTDRGDEQALAARAEHGDQTAQGRLADLLAARGDEHALAIRAAKGDWAARYRLADLRTDRAEAQSWADRADNGQLTAKRRLADLLAQWGDEDALAARADKGDWFCLERLADLLTNRGDLRAFAARADHGDWYLRQRLDDLLFRRGDDKALAARADNGDRYANERLAEMLANRGDQQALATRADDFDPYAGRRLVRLLAEHVPSRVELG